jgi:hypothetical protein
MPVTASCAPSAFGTRAGVRSAPRLVKNHLAWLAVVVVAVPLVLFWGSWEILGAESSPPPPATGRLEETNALESLHVYSQLQQQLQATQLAIEQDRQEIKAATAENAEALSKGLQSIQQAFSAQWARDLAALQRSNTVMLTLAGAFAVMGFLALLILTFLQWRLTKGVAEISAALPTALELGGGSGGAPLGLAEQSGAHLLAAIEQAEKRAHDLEQSLHPVLQRRKRVGMPIEMRLFPAPGDSFRRRQFRALKVAVIVGLISAAVVALLFYAAMSRKLGFG